MKGTSINQELSDNFPKIGAMAEQISLVLKTTIELFEDETLKPDSFFCFTLFCQYMNAIEEQENLKIQSELDKLSENDSETLERLNESYLKGITLLITTLKDANGDFNKGRWLARYLMRDNSSESLTDEEKKKNCIRLAMEGKFDQLAPNGLDITDSKLLKLSLGSQQRRFTEGVIVEAFNSTIFKITSGSMNDSSLSNTDIALIRFFGSYFEAYGALQMNLASTNKIINKIVSPSDSKEKKKFKIYDAKINNTFFAASEIYKKKPRVIGDDDNDILGLIQRLSENLSAIQVKLETLKSLISEIESSLTESKILNEVMDCQKLSAGYLNCITVISMIKAVLYQMLPIEMHIDIGCFPEFDLLDYALHACNKEGILYYQELNNIANLCQLPTPVYFKETQDSNGTSKYALTCNSLYTFNERHTLFNAFLTSDHIKNGFPVEHTIILLDKMAHWVVLGANTEDTQKIILMTAENLTQLENRDKLKSIPMSDDLRAALEGFPEPEKPSFLGKIFSQ
ncbi:MAG: hypothetical protein JSS53_02180 [Proteobacteria bacterium]|nr:hypothetical protein [Pseudomonadota bacterium]